MTDMNKLAMIAIATSAFALSALPAAAQQSPGSWYANLGYTQLDTNRGDLGAVTGRLGYSLTPNVAAEAEYSTGVENDTFGELDNAWGVYGVGSVPLPANFSVFGRVGYQEINIQGRNGATDSDGSGLGYGAGVQWNATSRVGVRSEYTRLDDADADAWSLSGVLNF
jgi:hypothetical protein